LEHLREVFSLLEIDFWEKGFNGLNLWPVGQIGNGPCGLPLICWVGEEVGLACLWWRPAGPAAYCAERKLGPVVQHHTIKVGMII
jgi:hypothetical protein